MTKEKADSIVERMCDEYCKFPKRYAYNIFLPVQIAAEKLGTKCRNCPLQELYKEVEV